MFEKLARGSGRLSRFVLKREWLRIVIWTVCLVGMSVVVVLAFTRMFDTPESRQEMVVAMENPAMVAMVGKSAGYANYTIGAMNAHMMMVFMAIAIGVMNIFMVVRHTRRDEELGRQELIRSLPVGHLAPLSATLMVAAAVNLVIGLGIGLAMAGLGVASVDFAGSILYGLALGAVGLVFAGIAAVTAQLAQTARGATSIAMGILIVSYLVRAVGDMNAEWLSRLSPLGLVMETEAAVNNIWWPVWVLIAIAAVLMVGALWLNEVRDMDQGFLPARPGRANASKWLQSPLGLSLRLMRGSIVAWVIVMLLFGASYGSVLGDTEAFSDTIATMTGGVAAGEDLAVAFVSVLMLILSLCACIPGLIMALKLRAEERRGRLEAILAGSVDKGRIFWSYVGPALDFSLVAMVLAVVGLWSAGVATMETPIAFWEMLRAVLVFLPAVWMTVGLAAFLIGVAPKIASWVWGFFVGSFLVVYVGNIVGLPEWAKRLTPFGWVSNAMVEDISWVPLIVTTGIAVALVLTGVYAYRRREMVS
ncbi:ABC transporter permease [Candidatus Saccharibacteria bacterium]|nr:ABC transporter permease [Candidatus Saccharibacteria bacterium]